MHTLEDQKIMVYHTLRVIIKLIMLQEAATDPHVISWGSRCKLLVILIIVCSE